MKTRTLQHKFVDYIPEHREVQEGILYISLPYCIAIHKCVCGCGYEVSTPLSPSGWQLIFDGETVSLTPSIGNRNYKCRSHYFITKGKVRDVGKFSVRKIKTGKRK